MSKNYKNTHFNGIAISNITERVLKYKFDEQELDNKPRAVEIIEHHRRLYEHFVEIQLKIVGN